MTPRRAPRVRRRGRHPDDPAVSTVLGAILMFGLFVLTLLMIQVRYVPVWDKQRERDFSLQVAGQVATVKADLDRLAANQTSVPISDPLSLQRPGGFSFFGARALPGVATFTPIASGAGMTITTGHTFAVQSVGGSPLYSLSEDWSWSGSAIASVTQIQHLRLRIPSPNGLPVSPAPLDFTIKDSNGNCLAELKLAAPGALLTKTIEAQMYAGQIPPVTACTGTAYDIQDTYVGASPSYYYLDAMGSSFLQAIQAIPSGSYPVTLAFTPGNTGGQVAVVYNQATQFGNVLVGGAGETFTSYNQVVPSAALSVQMDNQRLPDQTYVLEYGAEFVDQSDGQAMVVGPAFAVSTALSHGSIAWNFPALGGGSAGVTGARSATVVASPTGTHAFLQATARDITFTITTNHPAAWAAYWDTQFRLAGLSSSSVAPQAPCGLTGSGNAAPQYTIDTSVPQQARLTFFGPCSNPNDTSLDVTVTLQEATMALDLRPGG